MSTVRVETRQVLKTDATLGVVFGWAIVCTEKGMPYTDLQGDHISESEMLMAAVEFMKSARTAKEMHAGDDVGTVIFAWPQTAEMADQYGEVSEITGLKIGIYIEDKAVLAKFADGTYTGFSIGGWSQGTHDDEETA